MPKNNLIISHPILRLVETIKFAYIKLIKNVDINNDFSKKMNCRARIIKGEAK